MMRFSLLVSCGFALVLPALPALGDEVKVEIKDLPEAVRATVQARFPGAKLTKATKETEDGTTTYEVEVDDKGTEKEVVTSAAGKLLEVETEVAVAKLPKAVTAAIEAKYPGAKLDEAEEVVKVLDGGKEETSYEVAVKPAGKDAKAREIRVSSEGKILEDEVEDDADDKEDDKPKAAERR